MMLEEPETAKAANAPGRLHVDRWTDLLGGFIERHPRLCIRLGMWESRLLQEEIANIPIERPIYVTGLARSGSTILLELLARHPDVATHRYRDFPPVLLPWAWNWFVDRAATKAHVAVERAHRDRIAVTPESPEAFEELVWMAFFPGLHDTSTSAVLDDTTANPAFEAFYRDHIRKLLRLRGGTRYLAKGNYNVTRLRYLLKLFPDARFVVPVRDPVWHIASLMKQHALFCREEANNARVLRHMRRSGHFEFGLDRRAINTGDRNVATVRELWRCNRDVEGWAEYWALIYGHLYATLEASPALKQATHVVRYEDLCRNPAGVMSAILAHCGLAPRDLPEAARAVIGHPDYYKPAFTDDERALILQRTDAVARLFGYRADQAAA